MIATKARVAAAVLTILVSAVSATAVAVDRVELRSGDAIEGRISSLDAGGLSITRPLVNSDAGSGGPGRAVDVTDRYGWDRVATVQRDGRSSASESAEVARWLEFGERLWRARARLLRGDVALAEQALGDDWKYEPADGPTGVVAALVELQVALGRQELPRAWRAWLEVTRARRAGERDMALETWTEPSSSGVLVRRTLVDATTQLCPSLPPFVASDVQRAEVLAVLDAFDPRGDGELDTLRQALSAVLDPGREPPQAAATNVEGDAAERTEADPRRTLLFLRTLRALQHGTPDERADARNASVAQRRRLPDWSEAWSRFAAGSGLLAENSPEATRAGQVELMHLPARFADAQPWLSSRAAWLAADASRRAGELDEASTIETFIIPLTETP